MFNNKDMRYGALIGLLVPQVTFWAIYFGSLNAIPLSELFSRPGLMSKMIALSLIGNLVAFLVVLKKYDRDTMARGILLSTFIYGLAVGILKIME